VKPDRAARPIESERIEPERIEPERIEPERIEPASIEPASIEPEQFAPAPPPGRRRIGGNKARPGVIEPLRRIADKNKHSSFCPIGERSKPHEYNRGAAASQENLLS